MPSEVKGDREMKMNIPQPGSKQDLDGKSVALHGFQECAREYQAVLFSPFFVIQLLITLEQVSSLRCTKAAKMMLLVL